MHLEQDERMFMCVSECETMGWGADVSGPTIMACICKLIDRQLLIFNYM